MGLEQAAAQCQKRDCMLRTKKQIQNSVTCSGACSCEGGIITDGPDKYA